MFLLRYIQSTGALKQSEDWITNSQERSITSISIVEVTIGILIDHWNKYFHVQKSQHEVGSFVGSL